MPVSQFVMGVTHHYYHNLCTTHADLPVQNLDHIHTYMDSITYVITDLLNAPKCHKEDIYDFMYKTYNLNALTT